MSLRRFIIALPFFLFSLPWASWHGSLSQLRYPLRTDEILQSWGWYLPFSQGNSRLLYKSENLALVCGMQLCKVPTTESLQTFITEDWKPQHASSYQEEMVGGDGLPGYSLCLHRKHRTKVNAQHIQISSFFLSWFRRIRRQKMTHLKKVTHTTGAYWLRRLLPPCRRESQNHIFQGVEAGNGQFYNQLFRYASSYSYSCLCKNQKLDY
jgi:hypothetical protein